MLSRLASHLRQHVFDRDAAERGPVGRALVFVVRLLFAIVRRFRDNALHVQSTSLAYRTLLSLVPLLAVMFSVLKGFGVQNELAPFLMRSLEPLGERGAEIGQNILDFVNNLNFAVLGYTGVALLFWTVVSLLQRVEEAFDAIWEVPAERGLGRRFSTYLSVTLVGPVLMFSALGMTALVLQDTFVQRVAGIEPFGWLILRLGELIPYLLVCLAFAFLYAFLTSARVRPVPALAGGVFASVVWSGVGMLFARFVAGSSQYSAIYSGFAAAILFVVWLNVGWLIVLVGAHVARDWQRPDLLERFVCHGDGTVPSRPAVALEVMALIGRAHVAGGGRWTLEALSRSVSGGSIALVEDVLGGLTRAGLVVATDERPQTYVPARGLATIGLGEIVAAVGVGGGAACRIPAVAEVLKRVGAAIDSALAHQSLQDLAAAEQAEST